MNDVTKVAVAMKIEEPPQHPDAPPTAAELERVVAALRDSEERYHRLFEAETDAIFLVDCETGRFIDANEAALTLYGYTREELIRLTCFDVSAEPDKTRQAIAQSRIRAPLRWHRKKDGTVFPVEIAGNYFDYQGRKTHVGAIRDITERLKAQEALSRSEEQERLRRIQLEALMEAVPAAILIAHDPKCSRMSANRFAIKLLKMNEGSNPSKTAPEHQRPQNWEIINNGCSVPGEDLPMQRTARTGQPVRGEELHCCFTDGTSIWLYGNAVPIRDCDGKISGSVGVFLDISERKRTEESLHRAKEELAEINATLDQLVQERTAQLKEANQGLHDENEQRKRVEQNLRASEDRYRRLVQMSPNAICISRDNRIVFVNTAGLRLCGAEHCEQLLGKSPFDIFHPVSELASWEQIRQALKEGSVFSTTEGQIVRMDGTVREVESVICPFRDEAGISFQIILHDITERKLLDRRVLEAIEQERQRLGRELHDGLCQILSAAKFKISFLERELARRSQVEPVRLADIEQDINQSIEQARAMASGLNPAKLLAEGLITALEELAASVESAYQIRCVCRHRGTATIPDQRVALHLYRIAQEAVHNAARHSRARNIRILLKQKQDQMSLVVADNGVGFTSTPGRPEGMGLFNMKTRAELVGATLDIQSPKRGTVLTCTLRLHGKEQSF